MGAWPHHKLGCFWETFWDILESHSRTANRSPVQTSTIFGRYLAENPFVTVSLSARKSRLFFVCLQHDLFSISSRCTSMSSTTVFTTSSVVHCPSCAKKMLLKNWKDHCRQKHAMSQKAIDMAYSTLKSQIERSKTTAVSSTTTTDIDKPISVARNDLFSL